jgi:hypothetical protein
MSVDNGLELIVLTSFLGHWPESTTDFANDEHSTEIENIE